MCGKSGQGLQGCFTLRSGGCQALKNAGCWGPTINGTETYGKSFECPLRQRSKPGKGDILFFIVCLQKVQCPLFLASTRTSPRPHRISKSPPPARRRRPEPSRHHEPTDRIARPTTDRKHIF